VACGNLDGDTADEILTGPGPGKDNLARVRGWNYDGQALEPIDGLDFLAFSEAEAIRGVNVSVKR